MKLQTKLGAMVGMFLTAADAWAQGPQGGVSWGQAAAAVGVAFAVGVAVGYAAGKSSSSEK